ncbi:MAG: zinc-dependent alcohol dehydrogenase family protein [Pseudomonadota bacterium]
MRAAVLREIGKSPPYAASRPLCVEEVELDPPGPNEVLIQIKAAGLCHSDLVAVDGERAKPVPIVLGHEAAGVVVSVGPGVDSIAVGDHVVPSYVASCGRCEMCWQGRPALCIPATKANAEGTLFGGSTRLHRDGERIHHHSGVAAFAEYAVVSANAIIRIDKSIPFEHAALFGCAVATGVGSVLNTASVRPGESVAIVGLGGVGLSALLAAVMAGASPVVAVDVNDDKLHFARELGAHLTFNATEANCIEAVRAASDGGVHVAVETAGAARALDLAFKITRRGGSTVAAGMPGPDAAISLGHLCLAAEERTLKGSYMGSCVQSRDIPRFIRLFQDGKLPVDRLASHTVSLDELNEAFDRMVEGTAVRQILVL